MNEVKNQNIGAHYSASTKVKRPEVKVALPPEQLPMNQTFNDREATKKIFRVNNSINKDLKKEKSKEISSFLKILVGVVIAIGAFLGLKKFLKKS